MDEFLARKFEVETYCAECFEPIYVNDEHYECRNCNLWFCSFICLEKHECGVVKFPEIHIPWEDDDELKDLIE